MDGAFTSASDEASSLLPALARLLVLTVTAATVFRRVSVGLCRRQTASAREERNATRRARLDPARGGSPGLAAAVNHRPSVHPTDAEPGGSGRPSG
jgi:hypothetical protein